MKIRLIAGTSLLICLIGLTIIYFLTERNKSLFLVLPNETGSPGINIDKIEDFSSDEFPLTYEIQGYERVSLPQGEYPVTLIAANNYYAGIMGLTMIEGSFFTKQAWAGKQKQAVLNETAAFTIFGSSNIVGSRFRIRNDTWLVTGVVRDFDEDHSRIYVPSSVRGGEAAAVSFTVSGNLDAAYAINSLKTLGIRDINFDFIDFNVYFRLFFERIMTIPLIFFSLLLFSLIKPVFSVFIIEISSLKTELNMFYLSEILKNYRKKLFKTGFLGFVLLVSPVLAVFLLIRLVSVCLPWQDIPSLYKTSREFFGFHLNQIRILDLFSLIFFIISLAIIAIFIISLNIDFLKIDQKHYIKK